MNLDAGDEAAELGEYARKQLEMMLPKPMRDTVIPDGMQACVAEEHLQPVARRRVAIKN